MLKGKDHSPGFNFTLALESWKDARLLSFRAGSPGANAAPS